MATISSQSTRTSGRAQSYAKKDAVAISAVGASVPLFEQRLQEIRLAHDKDGYQPKVAADENGDRVVAVDSAGRPIYESKYVQAYSLVQSFGHEELDPSDPDSWTRANELGRAVAEDRFPGHPVLIATEVNGRSGCVHNHLIVGAVNAETGKSIDSNVVTHSRLALAHDQVLTKEGFEQREDMKEMALVAAGRIEQRRAEVIEQAGDLSPSQLERKLIAAENSVRLESQTEQTPHHQREAKRLREFDRYRLNEQDREAALDIGVTPPKEKFSEIELEARIKDTINDPRADSWEAMVEIGRENRVTIAPRGDKDVTYGMMLAQSDGTVAEPSRAHHRRGGVEGAKTPGLGDGFRRKDIEAAIDRNALLAREASPIERTSVDQVMDVDMSFLDEYRSPDAQHIKEPTEQQLAERRQLDELSDRVRTRADREAAALDGDEADEQTEVSQPSVDEEAQTSQESAASVESSPTIEEAAEPAFRSRLRDRPVKSARTRDKLDQLAALEEDYRGRQPDAAFEQRILDKERIGGAGPQLLSHYGEDMSEEFRGHLEARAELRSKARDVGERGSGKLAEAHGLQESGSVYQRHAGRIRTLEEDGSFDRQWARGVRDQVAEGDYTPRDYEADRHEHRKQQISQAAAALEPSEARQRLAEDDKTLRRAHDTQAFVDRDQDQDHER